MMVSTGAKLVPMIGIRRELQACRHHITQRVRFAGIGTLYTSDHDDEHPAEIFLRLKGTDCSSELIGLFDVTARLMSLALQYGAPFEKVGNLLDLAKFAPGGPVSGHDRLKSCTSLPDLIGRHLLVEYCGREDLVHVSASVKGQVEERNLSMGGLIEEGLKDARL